MFGVRVRHVMRQVFTIAQIVCVVLVLIGLGALAVMFLSGKTSVSMVKTSVKILLGQEREVIETVKEIAPKEFELSLQEFEKIKREQGKEVSRRRAEIETIEMSLRVQRKQLEEEKASFDQQKTAFQKSVADFNTERQAYYDRLADARFVKTKELIETAPPKTVVEMIKNWELNRIMIYLRAVETRIVSKILQEMQKSTDAQILKLVEDIHRQLD